MLPDQDHLDQEGWDRIKHRYPVGSVAKGSVSHHAPFGFFISLPENIVGLVELSYLPDGTTPNNTDSYPPIGMSVTAVVIHAADHNQQIRLSMRPKDLADSENTYPTNSK